LTTTLAGVLGFPVAHSRSPAMMNAAFEELGLDWRYVKLPVPPERFAETVRALPGSGYGGANVTIPHKLAANELADERSPAAEAIGAANTLIFDGGRIKAENTDAPAIVAVIGEDLSGRSALVLGAGGAGRAAVWALRAAGAEVAVWNRTAGRAERVARELGVDHATGPRAAELLVNATSVGLAGEPEDEVVRALPLDGCEPATVVDLVYGDRPTALSRWAAARGARVVDGLDVLARQGALAFERWTGREAPLDTMRRALATPPV
jgi:shikimate dehydrogenase